MGELVFYGDRKEILEMGGGSYPADVRGLSKLHALNCKLYVTKCQLLHIFNIVSLLISYEYCNNIKSKNFK